MLSCDRMVKIASRSKWDFGFDVLGAMRGGGVNFARAETIINLVNGGADAFGAVNLVLIEGQLRVGLFLELIKRHADNADGVGDALEELIGAAADIFVGIDGVLENS